MPYYYVNANAQDSPRNEHEVHTTGCPHPPLEKNRVSLGSHADCRDALADARRRGYSPVDGCYYCVPECHRT